MSPAALTGLRVLNPRPSTQAGALTAALTQAGAEVIELPLLAIEPLPLTAAARACLLDLDRYQATLFVSANAARLGLDAVAELWPQWPHGLPACAVGRATARILEAAGLTVVVPEREDSEGLLALPDLQSVQGQRWLLLRGDEGRELLPETLRARGAQVDVLPLYRRVLPLTAAAELHALPVWPDVVLLTSSLVWRHWQQVAGADWRRPQLIAVSPRLADAVAAEAGHSVLCADGAQPEAWLATLSDWRAGGAHGIQST